MGQVILAPNGITAKSENNRAEGTLTGAAVGYATEADAIAGILAFVPSLRTINGFSPRLGQIAVNRVGNRHWGWAAEYRDEDDNQSQNQVEPLAWRFRFNTGTISHKISKSKGTVGKASISAGITPRDFKGLINWDGKKAAGAEIELADGNFSIECFFAAATVITEWYRELKRFANRKNEDEWVGFPAGELLFKGPKGDQQIPLIGGARSKPVSVLLDFKHELNTTLEVLRENGSPMVWHIEGGGTSTTFEKEGHDLFWAYYKTVDIDGVATPVLENCYVEVLYDQLHFADTFGFGGP